MKKQAIFFLLVLSPLIQRAQENISDNLGGTVGISLVFGTTLNRIGIAANGFYFEDFAQLNSSLRLYWNIRSFGPRNSSREMQFSLGALGSWGKNNGEYYLLLSPVSNQTGYLNSAAYAYTMYLDNNGTTQPTGMLALQFGKFQVIHENDILVGTGSDKFRTGALLFAYQQENLRFGMNYTGWTGDPKTHQAVRVNNSDYPSKWGYKDLRNSTHGRFSHGIAALQAEGVFDYGQVVRADIGVDAEQIRNIMQNKLMHGSITRGAQYPMLDKDGNPYLYKEGQIVRPAKPFFEIMSNPPLFY